MKGSFQGYGILRVRLMKIKVLGMVLWAVSAAVLQNGGAFAHSCQLQGNDTTSISLYNQCKADLNIAGMHPNTGNEDISTAHDTDALTALREENRQLRLQLEIIKHKLFEVLKDL